jgi:hypothetical protein
MKKKANIKMHKMYYQFEVPFPTQGIISVVDKEATRIITLRRRDFAESRHEYLRHREGIRCGIAGSRAKPTCND